MSFPRLTATLISSALFLIGFSPATASDKKLTPPPPYLLTATFQPQSIRLGQTTKLTFTFFNNTDSKIRRIRFDPHIWDILLGVEIVDVPQSNFCGEKSLYIGTEVDMYDIPAKGSCSLATTLKVPFSSRPGVYQFKTTPVGVFATSISRITAYARPVRPQLTVLPPD